MMELLAPAGSPESVIAAVQNGADAIYLGCGSFNARRNAANFTAEDLKTAVEYCHLRDVRVYLTMNTLLYDRELEDASRLVRYADSVGVDAILVQDPGVLRMIRRTAPDMEVHASTQMTLHNLDGVRMMADLGISRAVLSRELSRDQIAHLCAHSPIELEVFVHGALCMCYSGQCYFSSVIGGRSGNRGLCAQPCRLKYGWEGKANRELLSLKDLSLVEYLADLEEMGVACAKIEGRMKRPEYVAIVTGIYSSVLRNHQDPTKQQLQQLEAAFSRQGFTQGYYLGQKGPGMFGVHQEGRVDPTPMFQTARADYQRGEHKKTPVTLQATILPDTPITISAADNRGNSAQVTGPVPQPAINRPLTAQQAEAQLTKAGGTPFSVHAGCTVQPGLSVPLSALNGLRRDVLQQLTQLRIAPHAHRQIPWTLPSPIRSSQDSSPVFSVGIRSWQQLSSRLLDLKPHRIEVPLQLFSDIHAAEKAAEHCTLWVTMPRILWDNQRPQAIRLLERAKSLGITDCLAATWGSIRLAREMGFQVHGDWALGVVNSESIRGLKAAGLASVTFSPEQRLARLRDLSRDLPCEVVVYGRLPLMITENCIISNRTGGKCKHGCQSGLNQLTDRKGAHFPVVQAFGCRNELLNSRPIYLADKPDYKALGCTAHRLLFTLESPEECASVLAQYMGLEAPTLSDYTRGLYYRDVE